MPELGDLYEYYLGITPEEREDFIDNLAGLDDEERERFAKLSDEKLFEEMKDSSWNCSVVDAALNDLYLYGIGGTAFVFHESEDDVRQMAHSLGYDIGPQYDSRSRKWGVIPARRKEFELREKLESTKDPREVRKLWREIHRLNKAANKIEEALTEIAPDGEQTEIQEAYGDLVLVNLVAFANDFEPFDVYERTIDRVSGIAIKAGNPHNALVTQHYIEQAVIALGNPRYELVPIKKYFGTDKCFVSEWVNEQRLGVDLGCICPGDDNSICFARESDFYLAQAYRLGGYSEYFDFDENVDIALQKIKELLQKLHTNKQLDEEERQVLSFYLEDAGKEQESATLTGYFSDEAVKKQTTSELFTDYKSLLIATGYAALARDLYGINPDIKEIPAEGAVKWDIKKDHILFRGINNKGAPQFSIIDQYHLGTGELEWKYRVYGDPRPKLRLG